MYSDKEKAEIVKEFFKSEGAREAPLCPHCADELVYQTTFTSFTGLQLDVECPGCRLSFTWSQPQPEQAWNNLQIEYFLERFRQDQTARCPVDDCFVTFAEFSDGVVQVNCPYCNRRGQSG